MLPPENSSIDAYFSPLDAPFSPYTVSESGDGSDYLTSPASGTEDHHQEQQHHQHSEHQQFQYLQQQQYGSDLDPLYNRGVSIPNSYRPDHDPLATSQLSSVGLEYGDFVLPMDQSTNHHPSHSFPKSAPNDLVEDELNDIIDLLDDEFASGQQINDWFGPQVSHENSQHAPSHSGFDPSPYNSNGAMMTNTYGTRPQHSQQKYADFDHHGTFQNGSHESNLPGSSSSSSSSGPHNDFDMGRASVNNGFDIPLHSSDPLGVDNGGSAHKQYTSDGYDHNHASSLESSYSSNQIPALFASEEPFDNHIKLEPTIKHPHLDGGFDPEEDLQDIHRMFTDPVFPPRQEYAGTLNQPPPLPQATLRAASTSTVSNRSSAASTTSSQESDQSPGMPDQPTPMEGSNSSAKITFNTSFHAKYWRNDRKNLQCFPVCPEFGDYHTMRINGQRHNISGGGTCSSSVEAVLNGFEIEPRRLTALSRIDLATSEGEVTTLRPGMVLSANEFQALVKHCLRGRTSPIPTGGMLLTFKATCWKLSVTLSKKRRPKDKPDLAPKYCFEVICAEQLPDGSMRIITNCVSHFFHIASTRTLARELDASSAGKQSVASGSATGSPSDAMKRPAQKSSIDANSDEIYDAPQSTKKRRQDFGLGRAAPMKSIPELHEHAGTPNKLSESSHEDPTSTGHTGSSSKGQNRILPEPSDPDVTGSANANGKDNGVNKLSSSSEEEKDYDHDSNPEPESETQQSRDALLASSAPVSAGAQNLTSDKAVDATGVAEVTASAPAVGATGATSAIARSRLRDEHESSDAQASPRVLSKTPELESDREATSDSGYPMLVSQASNRSRQNVRHTESSSVGMDYQTELRTSARFASASEPMQPIIVEDEELRPSLETYSVEVAYMYCLFLGLFGAHHFYLGRTTWGIVYACTLGLLGVGWFFDILRLPALVDRMNRGETVSCSLHETYILWGVLGYWGAHRFAMGQIKWGFYYLCTFGGLCMGWIIDAWRLPDLYHDSLVRGDAPSDDDNYSLIDAYILWLPGGVIGLHRFYLGDYMIGTLYAFTLGCLGFGWVYDFFVLPGLVRKKQELLEVRRTRNQSRHQTFQQDIEMQTFHDT